MQLSHAPFEKNSIILVVGILVVVAIGGLVEMVPLFAMKSTIEKVEGTMVTVGARTVLDGMTMPMTSETASCTACIAWSMAGLDRGMVEVSCGYGPIASTGGI